MSFYVFFLGFLQIVNLSGLDMWLGVYKLDYAIDWASAIILWILVYGSVGNHQSIWTYDYDYDYDYDQMFWSNIEIQ